MKGFNKCFMLEENYITLNESMDPNPPHSGMNTTMDATVRRIWNQNFHSNECNPLLSWKYKNLKSTNSA